MEKRRYKRGTDLESWCISEGRKEILEQFDYEKNYPRTPKDYAKSSDKKAYFKYSPCEHICLQRIADKTSKMIGCPSCMNRGAVGRSLADEYPEVAKMFDEKRNRISAKEISCKNGNEYWWICERCGRPFYGKVAYVVEGSQGCRECGNKRRTKPEYFLKYYLGQLDQEIELDVKIDNYKFDVMLPKYFLVVEYDGYPWHNSTRSKENDALKDEICKKRGLTLIRLRDARLDDNPALQSIVHLFNYDDLFEFFKQLPEVLEPFLGDIVKKLDIDVVRDAKFLNQFAISEERKKSLLEHMPCLNDYLDLSVDINGNPAYVTTATNKIRFWLRHPIYPKLTWSMTAHELFMRDIPETQWIKMCLKVLEKYPELEEQVFSFGNKIREESEFDLTCDCGKHFTKKYSQIIGKNRKKVTMCERCVTKSRMENLAMYRGKRSVIETKK